MFLAIEGRSKRCIAGKWTFVNLPMTICHVLDPFMLASIFSVWRFTVFGKTNVGPQVSVNMLPLSRVDD